MSDPDISAHLRDIQGIDAVSAWPPAPGWWLLLAATIITIIIARFLIIHYKQKEHRQKLSWRKDARRQLKFLKQKLDNTNGKATTSQLSELVRRIAIARFGRKPCAGLHGNNWLVWLTQHDPNNFDWENHGAALITLTYAPPDSKVDPAVVKTMINAALEWTIPNAGSAYAKPQQHEQMNGI